MNAQDCIKQMIVEYPSLFPSRENCLDHLFLVIGNGYEWEDGELTYRGRRNFEDSHLSAIERIHKRFNEDSQPGSAIYETLHPTGKWDNWIKRHEERLVKTQKIIDEVDIRCQPFKGEPQPKRLYPISNNYSKACVVPDNVKQDWLDAAYETLNLAMTIIITDLYDNSFNNPEKARKTIAELDNRFPGRKAKWTISRKKR